MWSRDNIFVCVFETKIFNNNDMKLIENNEIYC